jgi:hypothetical protein
METGDTCDEIANEPIQFGRSVCGTLAEAERREWWITNGRGGCAAGTIAGTLTRRYHGLLVAPVDPPLGRRLVFAKADATLLDGADSCPLFVPCLPIAGAAARLSRRGTSASKASILEAARLGAGSAGLRK